jgi:peptidyl-tRNA hydrolase, PTH1 family
MLLFYGLGNHSQKYFQTKHNSGRLVLENLLNLKNLKLQDKNGYLYTKQLQSYFLISKGFMNNSGLSLVSFMNYFKLDFEDSNFVLLILQDDSDQIVGSQKLVVGGGSGGHRGISDIYKQGLGLNLDLEKVWRLKIGIRPEENKQKSETFVLSGINNFEKQFYQTLAQKIEQNLTLFENKELAKLQTIFNSRL